MKTNKQTYNRMRQTAKYLLMSALAITTLAGCSNEDSEAGAECPNFTATIGAQTRAFNQSWESGDEIGISGANRTNVCYRTTVGDGDFAVKTQGNQIYFQGDGPTTFTAYYPWKNLSAGTTTIEADTRQQAQQKSFDFLWATASGSKDYPKVAFQFAHKMAKVSITVKPGSNMSYEEAKNTQFSLKGFQHTGSFNINTGSTTLKSGSEEWTFTSFALADDANETMTFSFIFFPQTFSTPLQFLAAQDTHTLKAEIDFTSANREKDGAAAKNEWVAGRQYNLSVTLNKTEITVDGYNINSWNAVNGDEISVD